MIALSPKYLHSFGKEIVDPQQVLPSLNFGRVDAETDDRLDSCFIGTDLFRQILLPQHSLFIGAKGSGKSAIFRLLCSDLHKIKPLLPRGYQEIYCIPAHGLQSDEYLAGSDLRELHPESVDDLRDFWLLYLGLKTVSVLVRDEPLRSNVSKSGNPRLKELYAALTRIAGEVGLLENRGIMTLLRRKMNDWAPQGRKSTSGKLLSMSFHQVSGTNSIALLDLIDSFLQEARSLAWVMLDKLDLLYIGDINKLKMSIAGLVQLLVEYSGRFRNIHFKIFLRTDIFRQLHIVNKSHLVSYTTDMKWRDSLLLKLFVSRAVSNPQVRSYLEEVLVEKVDVTSVITGDDDYVLRIFYVLFEDSMGSANSTPQRQTTHEWILKRLVDGMGTKFPRELVHLGNLAVAKQREMNRIAGRHTAQRLIGKRALREAFEEVSRYRCDTYLYSEFPHLVGHFDVFRGREGNTFSRMELHRLFESLTPKGDEAIRAVCDAGLLLPLGRNIDSSLRFKVPLLYRFGMGISDRRPVRKQLSLLHDKEHPAVARLN